MCNKNPLFKAIDKIGQSAEDAAVAWVQAATTLDFLSWETMEEALGARQAHIIYSRIWEKMAQNELPHVLEACGLKEKKNLSMHDIGEISRAYWEGISCPYRTVEETDDIHVGEVSDCPYWENMKILYGEERARDVVKKGMGATTANYYQAIIKELGLWDEIYATQDKCMCLGDDVCRVVFKKRSPKFKNMSENI